jgi:hypothetical protein
MHHVLSFGPCAILRNKRLSPLNSISEPCLWAVRHDSNMIFALVLTRLQSICLLSKNTPKAPCLQSIEKRMWKTLFMIAKGTVKAREGLKEFLQDYAPTTGAHNSISAEVEAGRRDSSRRFMLGLPGQFNQLSKRCCPLQYISTTRKRLQRILHRQPTAGTKACPHTWH